tara:strand:- start:3079 stop:3258 length:180 start_codon:yes stop_codon:yes gene_type:complete
MRIDDATIAMMPIEKMPISASRLLIGTRRLNSAGMGKSRITTSLSKLTAAENTQSRIGL